MAQRFQIVDRETAYLFPPSVQDWLPKTHLARFVVDVVEGLALSDLTDAYAGRGCAPGPCAWAPRSHNEEGFIRAPSQSEVETVGVRADKTR